MLVNRLFDLIGVEEKDSLENQWHSSGDADSLAVLLDVLDIIIALQLIQAFRDQQKMLHKDAAQYKWSLETYSNKG